MRRAWLGGARLLPYIYRRSAIDIGCGGGFMVEVLARLGASAEGVDISKSAIAYARNRFPKRQFEVVSFEHLAERGKTYDFVYSSEVIEHVSDLERYTTAIAVLLRDRGFAYVTTPNIGSCRVPVDVTAWDVFEPPTHVHFFRESNIRLLFGRKRLTLVRRYSDRKAGLKLLFRKLDS